MHKTSTKFEESINVDSKKTPEKVLATLVQQNNIVLIRLKETKEVESSEFKPLEKTTKAYKSVHPSLENGIDQSKTPDKKVENFELKLDQITSCDGEEGMISTTEQARLLLAASKTPSKSFNKTPVKQSAQSGKRSLEDSPVTPGKFRRVELITLASPKAKKIKQL